jgi:formamidopyrimidine-DNA glycosylase
MPELPEVHTIATDLKKHISKSKIVGIDIKDGYKTLPGNQEFIQAVLNQEISDVNRIAKNIKIDLSNSKSILIHLAMTGRVLIRRKEFKADSWERVIFTVEKNGKQIHVRFCDMRMFGKVKLLEQSDLEEFRNKYGPEPLKEDLTPEEFLKQVKSKKTSIKNALLDQKVISGLGNIYATDALFLAKIHPETPTTKLTLLMAEKLLETSRIVLEEGIEHRGSTLDDLMYVDVFGKPGSHQDHFKVYSKKTCAVCETKIDYKKINGRGTYFCPSCQKML